MKFEGIGFYLYDVATLDLDKEAAIFGAPLTIDVKGLSPRRAVRHDQGAQRPGMEQARHGVSPGPNKGVNKKGTRVRGPVDAYLSENSVMEGPLLEGAKLDDLGCRGRRLRQEAQNLKRCICLRAQRAAKSRQDDKLRELAPPQ